MSFTTWVRAQDTYGQFDVRKGDALREGVTLVPNYPEFTGMCGRPGKAKVDLGGEVTVGYAAQTIPQLKKEIAMRNDEREEGAPEIVPEGSLKADLIDALEADDTERELDTDSSDAQPSDTGEEETTTTDAGTGAESE